MRRLCLGDVHGGYKALLQVFDRSNFNNKEDQLYCLGDVADVWSEVSECFDRLLQCKHLIYIIGNHDQWLLDYLNGKPVYPIWTSQGGQATINNYMRRMGESLDMNREFLKPHKYLLENAHPYWITDDNKLFVHGGFDWHLDIKDQNKYDLMWDRELFEVACMWQNWNDKGKPLILAKAFDEVFIGHTATSRTHKDLKPVHVSNVWNLDQGAGYEGKLTLLDIDTKEFWQSDLVKTLYPNERGR
jgi:serine/threonine protein phosphatase 1